MSHTEGIQIVRLQGRAYVSTGSGTKTERLCGDNNDGDNTPSRSTKGGRVGVTYPMAAV